MTKLTTISLAHLLCLASVGSTISVAISMSVGGRLLGNRLLVGLEVEVDEEEQVARQDRAAKECGIFMTSTVGDVWQVGPVHKGEVLVSAKVDQRDIQDELGDLHGRKVFLPPEASTTSGRVVVVVHDNMNEQVLHDDGP